VIHTPANDVWSAVDDAGVETLVPAIAEVVASVDVEARRVVVREVPGLTAPG
jgi:ribosomal 30S subunit maturation factor RimM